MRTFNTEFDKGTFGHDDYDIIKCEVEYSMSRYIPERAYLSNGDPGYPAEGGDIEDFEVYDMEGNKITEQVPQKDLDRMIEYCYTHYDKY